SPAAVAAAAGRPALLRFSQPGDPKGGAPAECPANPALYDPLSEAGRYSKGLFAPLAPAYVCHAAAQCWRLIGGGQRADGPSLSRCHAPLYPTVRPDQTRPIRPGHAPSRHASRAPREVTHGRYPPGRHRSISGVPRAPAVLGTYHRELYPRSPRVFYDGDRPPHPRVVSRGGPLCDAPASAGPRVVNDQPSAQCAETFF